MAGTFPPDYFAPDYFAPEYFGGETNANAMSATIAGVATVTADLTALSANIAATISGASSVTASLSVAAAAEQDYDSHWHYARTKRKARAAREKAKPVPVVPGVLVAKIKARGSVFALGEAPRVCWPMAIQALICGASTLTASIEGPDRIEEQDMQDIEDILVLYEILLAA